MGKHFCIDSAYYPAGGDWLWANGIGLAVVPDWDGPHCFSVGTREGMPDGDSDGIPDSCDNCPEDFSHFQADANGNGIGDACEGCCNHDGIRGDADYSMALNEGDLTYLVSHLFDQPPGPAPPCVEEGDADGSNAINAADLTYLVEYLFFAGPAPAPCP